MTLHEAITRAKDGMDRTQDLIETFGEPNKEKVDAFMDFVLMQSNTGLLNIEIMCMFGEDKANREKNGDAEDFYKEMLDRIHAEQFHRSVVKKSNEEEAFQYVPNLRTLR